uniref:Uncharacterized protein n=1 Tax=Ursus maritimus TaxID=29073 RepID=A0A452TM67_URSMA
MSIQLIFDKGTNNNGESVVSSINGDGIIGYSHTLPPNSKYAKVNAGGWLHYPALPTLKGQDTDTLLKVVFSGCSEVLTGAGERRWLSISQERKFHQKPTLSAS